MRAAAEQAKVRDAKPRATKQPAAHARGEGEGARLREGPAPELMRASFALELADAPILYRGLSFADMAHVLVLRDAGVIPKADARRLLDLLLELHELPLERFPLDPALEDVSTNREAWVRKRDAEAAGWLGAGRPRREPATIAYRIAVRERLLRLAAATIALGRALVAQAKRHVGTIAPDYTYLQPATPTSLAHYLLSFAYPLLRDLDRLRAAFARTNQCPGGIGNINGSRLPMDRRRLAELLGFDGPVVHTRDAMWQVDQPVELMAQVTMLLLHADRLAEDLQIWNTAEFSLVELADRHARISMIMPQKKNPYSLAFVRGMTGSALGRLASMAAVGKTPSAQMDNRIFPLGEVPRTLEKAAETVELMAAVVDAVGFDVERMRASAGRGFTHAMDLAEAITREAGVPYRPAHRVVGLAVRTALERDPDARTIPPDVLEEAAQKVLGRALRLPRRVLATVEDPAAVVATRTCLGGAAEAPVRAMIRDCTTQLDAAERWRRSVAARISRAEERLLARARASRSGVRKVSGARRAQP
ncbi:MAG TPA: argininosuccinate lyase [Candidatus Binatia bacterium]